MRHEHIGDHGEQGDRCEIGAEIESRICLRRVECIGHRRHEKRIAVGRRARNELRADHAAVARPVFHDDWLAEFGFHVLADKTGKNVGGRSRPEPDDDLDRLRRIGLRCDRRHAGEKIHRNG